MNLNPYRVKQDYLITQKEAAAILQISAPTVKVLTDEGILPRRGKRFLKSAVIRLKNNPQGI